MQRLIGEKKSHVLALLHLGLEDLAVVFHAHDVGLRVRLGASLALRGHGGIDVPGGEDVGERHAVLSCVFVGVIFVCREWARWGGSDSECDGAR